MQEKNSKKSAQEKSGLTQQIAAHHKSIIGILLVLFVAFIVSVVAVSFGGGSGLQGSFQRFENPRTSTESSLSCITIYLNPEECFVNNPDYECAARSNPLFGYMTDKDGDGLVGPDDPDCRRYVN